MSDIPAVVIQSVSKSFTMTDKTTLNVLNDISLYIEGNEFICLLGYSGCGKTTLLRVVCGFEKADTGVVLIDGERHDKASKNVLMMFQDFDQIFPWKTVLQNVTYPLSITNQFMSKEEISAKALKRINDVGLLEFKDAYPHQLSGGMKQRVAVARALVLQPRVLLMDEPFAALDTITRKNLQELTKKICDKYGVTVIFVTHSVDEAISLATRIVVMNTKGSVEKIFDNSCTSDCKHKSKERLEADIKRLLNQFAEKERAVGRFQWIR